MLDAVMPLAIVYALYTHFRELHAMWYSVWVHNNTELTLHDHNETKCNAIYYAAFSNAKAFNICV